VLIQLGLTSTSDSEMAPVQYFSGPDRPWPTTSSQLIARGPSTFILFQTGPPMAR